VLQKTGFDIDLYTRRDVGELTDAMKVDLDLLIEESKKVL
jgi:hypothetical protein